MGVIASAGKNCDEFFTSISNGTPSFSAINRLHCSHFRATHAGFVQGFSEESVPHPHVLAAQDRFVQFAAIAAQQALFESGISPVSASHRMGLLFATCSGPMQTIERYYAGMAGGDRTLTKEQLFAKRYYSGAILLARAFGIGGICTTVTTACSASLSAIGFAADLIRLGLADAVLAGGSDTFSETTLAGFDGLKATVEGFCAPFSKPFGLNLGEGAAFVVVESLEHAQSRKALVLAEVMGFGLSNDAVHCTAPDPSGAGQALAMERALADAGIAASLVSYVNAHGTGTEANDKTESRAIKKVFGIAAEHLPVSSTKSMIGHCLGAAGSCELVASVLCLAKKELPPTANFKGGRDGCTLDYVGDLHRTPSSFGPMLTNNFAFGGNNASMVLNVNGPFPGATAGSDAANEAVITGIGILSAAGTGTAPFLNAIERNRSCFTKSSVGSLPGEFGFVSDFLMRDIDRRLDDRNMDRSSRFALAAARLAMIHACIGERQSQRKNLGLYLHLSAGPSWAEEEHISALMREKFSISQVHAFPYIVPNSVAGNVCKAIGLSGHNTTLCFGPGAGIMGLGFAAQAINANHSEALISLSADELSDRIIADLSISGLLAQNPYSYGEGACGFVVESREHAQNRGAKILATICSSAYSTHTGKENDRATLLANTIARSLSQAKILASEVACVCCNLHNELEKSVISYVMQTNDLRRIDTAPQLGFAEATLPLYNLAYSLLGSGIEYAATKNYILVVFSSDYGTNCSTVIRKEH